MSTETKTLTNADAKIQPKLGVKALVQIGMLSAIAIILMMFEIPLPFAPTFYKIDLSEVPVLVGCFAMGPMAGVGDSLDWATFKPIIFALGATLSAQGSPIGCFVLLLLPIIQMIIGTNFAAFGYRKGRSSVRSILGSGKIQQLLTAASALGIYMMGALSSTYVKLSTPLQFTFGKGNEPYVIQNILDGIVPGLLPLLAVLAVYWWLNKKNQNMVVIMLMIVAVSLVGAFFGIF